MPKNRALNIWLLKAGEPLPLQSNSALLRTGLLAEELANRGHKVTWWTSAWDHRHKKWIEGSECETAANGVRLFLLRGLGYSRNISLRRFRDHRKIAARFSELAVDQPKPDVIVASLPPYDSAAAAVDFARAKGIPVVVDLRDEWPDLFLDKLPRFLRPLGRIALQSEFKLMQKAVRGATALTSMMDGMLNWGLKHAGRERRPLDRVFYLGAATPSAVGQVPSPTLNHLKEKVAGQIVVTYVGTFGVYADPRYLLQAATQLPKVAFVFAGEGPLLAEMKAAAKNQGNVYFPGWLSSGQIEELMSFTHFGICPNTSFREALPNKALSFFAAGKPVLCFLQGDIQKIVESEKIGYCFEPGNAQSLQQTLHGVDVNHREYIEMCERVKKTFAQRFDAKIIYAQFADYLENLAARPLAPKQYEMQVTP